MSGDIAMVSSRNFLVFCLLVKHQHIQPCRSVSDPINLNFANSHAVRGDGTSHVEARGKSVLAVQCQLNADSTESRNPQGTNSFVMKFDKVDSDNGKFRSGGRSKSFRLASTCVSDNKR
jgi:hypothetical protein